MDVEDGVELFACDSTALVDDAYDDPISRAMFKRLGLTGVSACAMGCFV